MPSLVNPDRPPVFCPGCSHDAVLGALDRTFQNMGLKGNQVCMVSDIGCSGLFDTFFNTHALHGLHGRVLTYAAGLKLAQSGMTVVATIGDGGLGIGGAHLLAACRRNLDITLLVLNNFNFGMTGGQFSATTPPDALVGSGFLNTLEKPLDAAAVFAAAGAPFVARASATQKGLSDLLQAAISYPGFALVDIWGVCTGRYIKRNKLTPKMINQALGELEAYEGEIAANRRPEYGASYRQQQAGMKPASPPAVIEARFEPPQPGRQEVVILGAAGQRVQTAGDLLGYAALSAGMFATQKNEYNITVLRGPSISELILDPEPIDYHGSSAPSVVVALADEGVARRRAIFAALSPQALVLRAAPVEVPDTEAQVEAIDYKALGLRRADWALASLAALAQMNRILSPQMLEFALDLRFKGKVRAAVGEQVAKVQVS